ncbi:dnaJ homolog subfamily B member 6-like [Convolutriloba macropyga]
MFNDFFRNDPVFDDLFPELGRFNNQHEFKTHEKTRRHSAAPRMAANSFFSTGGFNDPFFSSSSFAFSSSGFGGMGGDFGFGGGGGSFTRKVSTSTKIVNGRQIVTEKVTENGVTTETVKENGQVISQKTITGGSSSSSKAKAIGRNK